jgi:hypothetical protein
MTVMGSMILLAGTLGAFEAEQGGIRIRADVQSSIYTWQVTNVSAPPITRFEIGQHHGYFFVGPKGWEVDADDHTFRAWTRDRLRALYPGRTGTFSLRMTSGGAVLGPVRAELGFGSAEPVVFEGVWGTAAEPRRVVSLVALVLLAAMVGHTMLLARRDRARHIADS